MAEISITAWTDYLDAEGVVLGHFSIELDCPCRIAIEEVQLCVTESGRFYLAMPSYWRIDEKGKRLFQGGRRVHQDILHFADSAARKNLETRVLAALEAFKPEVFTAAWREQQLALANPKRRS